MNHFYDKVEFWADAINISGLLNLKKLGNFKNRMLLFAHVCVIVKNIDTMIISHV